MRRRQQDCVDGLVGENGVEIGGQLEPVLRGKASCGVDVGLDGPDDRQSRMAARGLDEIATPAAEACNRSADHPMAPNLSWISILKFMRTNRPHARYCGRSALKTITRSRLRFDRVTGH